MNAYSKGLFPWFNDDDPILWWHPNPRLVLIPDRLHISKNMRRLFSRIRFKINSKDQDSSEKPLFFITINKSFERVIEECASKRGPGREATWISNDLAHSFIELNHHGYAHSVEVWEENKLVGGLYGMALGQVFFGESMFSHVSNASKLAMIQLCQILSKENFLIDCQVRSEHLLSLGATEMDRSLFIAEIAKRGSLSQTRSPLLLENSWSE